MSNEPTQEVKPTDELGDEELDNVVRGVIINWQPAPTTVPTAPPILGLSGFKTR
jgi:hypothetical protein